MPPTLQFGPLGEERARIDRLVRRLHETSEPTERADLAAELVRAASRYEDVVERVLVPRMDGLVPSDAIERRAEGRRELRDAMTVVHEATMHMDPRNVHASDPDGFERSIDDVLRRIEAHLDEEDRAVSAVFAQADGSAGGDTDERRDLDGALVDAARLASERPHPPKSAIGRFVSNAHVKLDHNLEDVSTPRHPGAPAADGEERSHAD